jgi:hypothetical protein
MTRRSIANPVIPKREAQRMPKDLLMKKGYFDKLNMTKMLSSRGSHERMLPNVSMTSRSIANPVIPKREAQRNSQKDLLMKKGYFDRLNMTAKDL